MRHGAVGGYRDDGTGTWLPGASRATSPPGSARERRGGSDVADPVTARQIRVDSTATRYVENRQQNTLASQVNPQDPGVHLTYAPQAYDAVVVTVLAAAVAGTDEPAAIAKEINRITKTGEK